MKNHIAVVTEKGNGMIADNKSLTIACGCGTRMHGGKVVGHRVPGDARDTPRCDIEHR